MNTNSHAKTTPKVWHKGDIMKHCLVACLLLISTRVFGEKKLSERLVDSHEAVRQSALLSLESVSSLPEPALVTELQSIIKASAIDERLRAIQALGMLGALAKEACPTLQGLLQAPQESLRIAAAASLVKIASCQASEKVIAAATDPSMLVRRSAMLLLYPRSREPSLRHVFLRALHDPDERVRRLAVQAVSLISNPLSDDVFQALLRLIQRSDSETQVAVLRVLQSSNGRDNEICSAVLPLMQSQVPAVREATVNCLGGVLRTVYQRNAKILGGNCFESTCINQRQSLTPKEKLAEQAIVSGLKDKEPTVRRAALRVMVTLPFKVQGATEALLAASVDEDASIKQEAMNAIYRTDPASEGAKKMILAALQDADPNVQVNALRVITDPQFKDSEKTWLPIANQLLSSKHEEVRVFSLAAIASADTSDDEFLRAVHRALEGSMRERQAAFQLFAYRGRKCPPELLGAIAVALADPDESIRQMAGQILENAGELPEPTVALLKKTAQSADRTKQLAIAGVLLRQDPHNRNAQRFLLEALKGRDIEVRRFAIEKMGMLRVVPKDLADAAIAQLKLNDRSEFSVAVQLASRADRLDSPSMMKAFIQRLESDDERTQTDAAYMLQRLGSKARGSETVLLKQIEVAKTAGVQLALFNAYQQIHDKNAPDLSLMVRLLASANEQIRLQILPMLTTQQNLEPDVVSLLLKSLNGTSSYERKLAIDVLLEQKIIPPEVITAVRRTIPTLQMQEQRQVIAFKLKDRPGIMYGILSPMMEQSDDNFQELAIRAVGSSYVQALLLLQTNSPIRKKEGLRTMRRIAGRAEDSLIHIRRYLSYNDDTVRREAILSYFELTGAVVKPSVLQEALQVAETCVKDVDPEIRRVCVYHYAKLEKDPMRAGKYVQQGLKDSSSTVRTQVIESFGAHYGVGPSLRNSLMGSLRDKDAKVISAAVIKMRAMNDNSPEFQDELLRLVRHPDSGVRETVLSAMEANPLQPYSKMDEMAQAVLRASKDSNPNVRSKAVLRIGSFTKSGGKISPVLLIAAKDPDPLVRQNAVISMRWLQDDYPELYSAVINALKDPDARVREQAVNSVAMRVIDKEERIQVLTEMLSDPELRVRQTANSSIAFVRSSRSVEEIRALRQGIRSSRSQ